MPDWFDKYTVQIQDSAFETPAGRRFEKTAEISFFGKNNQLLRSQRYAYTTADEVFKIFDNREISQRVDLDYCYINNFSLRSYREKRKIPLKKHHKLPPFSASHAFFDSTNGENFCIDFSYSHFQGESLNFSHATFVQGSVSFAYAKTDEIPVSFESCFFPAGNADFSGFSSAKGKINFSRVVFGHGSKMFKACYFGKGETDFSRSNFGSGEVNFEKSVFPSGNVSFRIARFGEGKTNFNAVSFGIGTTTFERVRFGGGMVNFENCNFGGGTIDFTRTEFGKGQVSFREARFGKGTVTFLDADFQAGKVNFKLADFGDGKTDFHYARFGKGDLLFERAKFGSGIVDFSTVDFNQGRVNFKRAEFADGELNFEASTLRNSHLTFLNTVFGKGSINFAMADFRGSDLVFENVDFQQKTFNLSRARLRLFALISCHINNYFDLRVSQCQSINLSNSIVRDILDLRPHDMEVKIDDLSFAGLRLLGRMYIDWRGNDVKKFIYAQNTSYRSKSEQFRILKENFNSIGQYNDEDLAYVEFKRSEMKANLLEATRKNPKSRFWLYPRYAFEWLIFDKVGQYATNPVRVLISMVVTYVIFSLIYILLPFFVETEIVSSLFEPDDPRNLSHLQKAFYHSAITFLTIGYGDFYPSGIDRWISGIEGFIGLFLMSYFTVAFVRKILR